MSTKLMTESEFQKQMRQKRIKRNVCVAVIGAIVVSYCGILLMLISKGGM